MEVLKDGLRAYKIKDNYNIKTDTIIVYSKGRTYFFNVWETSFEAYLKQKFTIIEQPKTEKKTVYYEVKNLFDFYKENNDNFSMYCEF